jgi:diadenosine tetraphosphate (Ap4A) HIT family hydrolase
MDLTPEQINEIRKQLVEQINNSYPEDKKEEFIQKISSMEDEELIIFLERSGAIKDSQNTEESSKEDCIFCSIISENIPSIKIYEKEKYIAILEINPLSEGHTIIVPKEHSNIIDEEFEEFAKEIKEKLRESLKPKDIILEKGELFGHSIISLIPVYGDTLETKRKKATQDELKKTKEKIIFNEEESEHLELIDEKEIIPENFITPKRIP